MKSTADDLLHLHKTQKNTITLQTKRPRTIDPSKPVPPPKTITILQTDSLTNLNSLLDIIITLGTEAMHVYHR